jgi:hypothetical protein
MRGGSASIHRLKSVARYPDKASPQTAIVLRTKDPFLVHFARMRQHLRAEHDRAERSEPPVSTGGRLAAICFTALSVDGTGGGLMARTLFHSPFIRRVSPRLDLSAQYPAEGVQIPSGYS